MRYLIVMDTGQLSMGASNLECRRPLALTHSVKCPLFGDEFLMKSFAPWFRGAPGLEMRIDRVKACLESDKRYSQLIN